MPGLTWRTLLALIYIIVCFQPGFAYLSLVTISPVDISVVQWATVLLFMELARLTGKPLTRQEVIIIFLGTVGASRYQWFLAPALSEINKPGWLYQVYFAHSPAAEMFGLQGKIPSFYAPTSVFPWTHRTFFDPSWIPIAMCTIAFGIGAYVSDVCVGTLLYRLYVVQENMPFPLVIPVVKACDALLERDWTKMGILAIVTAVSSIYSFVAYVFPLLTQTFWGYTWTLIPLPWADYSSTLQVFLPGISFGIVTSLSIMGYGLIIPFKAALGMFIGAVAVYMIGNPLLIKYGITGFSLEYKGGMPLDIVWERSFLYMWAMPLIGFGLAVGIIPLLLNLKVVRAAFSGFRGGSKTLWWILIAFLGVTIGLSIFDYWLAPDMPIFVFIFINTGWLFVNLLIRTRGEGLGLTFEIPYVRELTFKGIGYTGINGWFVPTLFGGTGYASGFKICDMTNTRKIDYILAVYVALPLGLIVAFYYMQSFWSLAPIPSNVYPGVLYTWPILSTFQALFISPQASQFFSVDRILYSFIIGSALCVIGRQFGFEMAIVGMAAGIAGPLPTAVSIFIGALAGLILRKTLKNWWNENVGLVVAGLILGEGITTAIGTAVVIIAKNIWALPY